MSIRVNFLCNLLDSSELSQKKTCRKNMSEKHVGHVLSLLAAKPLNCNDSMAVDVGGSRRRFEVFQGAVIRNC